jgi:hypothetical protein
VAGLVGNCQSYADFAIFRAILLIRKRIIIEHPPPEKMEK